MKGMPTLTAPCVKMFYKIFLIALHVQIHSTNIQIALNVITISRHTQNVRPAAILNIGFQAAQNAQTPSINILNAWNATKESKLSQTVPHAQILCLSLLTVKNALTQGINSLTVLHASILINNSPTAISAYITMHHFLTALLLNVS